MLLVNNIYGAIQGEGVHTGVPMVILRLQGCGVGCPFCDTKETWAVDSDQRRDRAEALGVSEYWCEMSPLEIVGDIAERFPTFQWVMVTGGEPAEQRLKELVNALHGAGLKAAIETSGTARGHLDADFDWVCVSPKVNMPGGQELIPEVMKRADEIKHVVGKASDIDTLDGILDAFDVDPNAAICVQPMSQNEAATRLCVEAAQQRGWRLSAQLHKYLDLP